LQRLAYPNAQRFRFVIIEGRVDYDAELIAAKAREEQRVIAHLLHPPGRLNENIVTGGMPVEIVDGLEAVEVDEANNEAVPGLLRAVKQLADFG
jgi:hypothetical protein